MKKMYLAKKRKGNPDIGSFLSNMGHNVMASIFCGKSNEVKKTLNSRTSLVFENNHDVSTWIPENEKELSVLEHEEKPYYQRKVGQTRRRQEEEDIISRIPWLGKKCPSCNHGFNRTSNIVQCHSCDSFTHKKSSCLVSANDDLIFHCKKCKTPENQMKPKPVEALDCKLCNYKSNTKFNLERHIARKHKDGSLPNDSTSLTLQMVLDDAGVGGLSGKFKSEGIDIKLLLDLHLDDLRRMLKDLEINWGERYKIEKQIDVVKKGKKTIEYETPHEMIAHVSKSAKEITIDVSNSVTLEEIPEIAHEMEKDEEEVIPCDLCTKAAKQNNPQHKCRICSKVVCSILCSIPDPKSDNEMHRVHKHGDNRCVVGNTEPENDQVITFDCPRCSEHFGCSIKLQSHIAKQHEEFESTFPTMSLASDGSISDIYETCKQCGKVFENELDLANHEKRVHEYGETFALYPCEECGYRGTDLKEINTHIEEAHRGESLLSETEASSLDGSLDGSLLSETEASSLEELGIKKLPEITQRRKQNLKDLNIDENGEILMEDDTDDEDFDSQEELLLLEEDDWVPVEKLPISTRRTRATIEMEDIIETGGKRKANEQDEASKRQKTGPNSLQCTICDAAFTRKDNLARHVKNKH